jgi:toxin secretion/phage lysis holin
MFITLDSLNVVQAYLFGEVKFLDLLVLLMGIDIVTGIIKAWKNKKLRSRTGWFGYVRKIGIFGAIIAANIIDIILDLNGAIAYSTVLFYIVNEILSVVENLAEMGVKVPKVLTDKLHTMQTEEDKKEGK